MATTHTGQGGKSFQDRELAAEVRTLTLQECKKALKSKKNRKFYEAVLLKLAGTVLPRLNEHSGPEGNPIPIYASISKHKGNRSDIQTEEKD